MSRDRTPTSAKGTGRPHLPRLHRVALPYRHRGHFVAAHDQRTGAHGGAGADDGARQGDGVGAEGGRRLDRDGVQRHDAVLEQVRLYDGARPDGGAGAHGTQVGFGEPVGLDPRPGPQTGQTLPGGGAVREPEEVQGALELVGIPARAHAPRGSRSRR